MQPCVLFFLFVVLCSLFSLLFCFVLSPIEKVWAHLSAWATKIGLCSNGSSPQMLFVPSTKCWRLRCRIFNAREKKWELRNGSYWHPSSGQDSSVWWIFLSVFIYFSFFYFSFYFFNLEIVNQVLVLTISELSCESPGIQLSYYLFHLSSWVSERSVTCPKLPAKLGLRIQSCWKVCRLMRWIW